MDDKQEFSDHLHEGTKPEDIVGHGSATLPALTGEGIMFQGLSRTIGGQVLAELKEAEDCDKRNRKVPSLPTLAWLIKSGKFYDRLPDDVIAAVAAFLAAEHREKRGAKRNRQLHILRALQFVEYMRETGGDKLAALDKLEFIESVGDYTPDIRNLERSVALGLTLQEEDLRATGQTEKSLREILEEQNFDYPKISAKSGYD